MNLNAKRVAALVASYCLLSFTSTYAQDNAQYVYEEESGADYASYYEQEGGDTVQQTSYCGECNGGGCSSCGGLLGDMGIGSRRGQFYVTGEYLQVRASFSEATAFVTQTQSVAPITITNTFNQFEYDYEPSYRVYGGYRLCECGCEIQFGYTNYNSDSALLGTVPDNGVIIGAPEEVTASNPGDMISANSEVEAQMFDLAFAKTIPLGGCCCDPCCDTCCDTCCDDCCCDDTCCGDCCCTPCCPAWDITWYAGVRFADVGWDKQVATVPTVSTTVPNPSTNTTVLDFEGVGPRWGLEGKRYLGKRQCVALFLRGDISLLLGDVSIRNATFDGQELTTYSSSIETTQVIPVLDIVTGGTVYLGNHFSVSGGYLFSAWHDLGMRDTYDLLEDPGTQNPTDFTFDDANILSFDGWFVRGEVAF